MNNLKTAVLVVLLLGALYGAYQFLNQRDVPPPPEAQLQFEQGIAPPTIEFGTMDMDFAAAPATLPTAASASELDAPSPANFEASPFAVMPGVQESKPQEPKFDELPPRDSTPALVTPAPAPTAVEPTAPGPAPAASPVTDAAVRPAEHSAYAPETPRVAASDISFSKPSPEDIPNLQSNPWYRPERNSPGESANGAMSPEASRKATQAAFQRAWSQARDLVERRKFAAALAELTVYYNNPELSAGERMQLQKSLDSLAGRVIYSTEHYLAEPHTVRADETLMDIAKQYNVQWQLLQNINGIRDPYVLVPKTQLKVMHGPFRAEVDLQSSHLTLFVDKYYAGRFPVTIGREPMPAPGTYTVRDKREGKDYYPANGRTIAAGHPANPYGRHWLDLGSEICIHGSADRDVSPDFGCISLSPIDAADVYGILSLGSTVTVRR